MVLCLRLMRMVAACHRYAMFYHRSGMLSHCLHLLRYILDASPATRPVRMPALQQKVTAIAQSAWEGYNFPATQGSANALMRCVFSSSSNRCT